MRRDPGDRRLQIRLAAVLVRAGQRDRAVAILRDVARQYQDSGQPVAAVRVYQHLLQIAPDDVDARLELADVYANMGLRNDAASEYRACIAVLTALGDDARRLDAIERLLRLDPANVAAHVRIAEEYVARGDNEAAARHFREAADELWNAGDFEDFVPIAERLLHCDEGDFESARRLATVYARRGQPHKALPLLERCFRRKQDDPEVLEALATVFEALHQSSKAAIVYKLLARLWHRRGADDRAMQAWSAVLELDPEDVEARNALAEPEPAEAAAREIEFEDVDEEDSERADVEPPARVEDSAPNDATDREAVGKPEPHSAPPSSGSGSGVASPDAPPPGPWQEEPTLLDVEIPQRVLEVVRGERGRGPDLQRVSRSSQRRLEEVLREFDFFADQGLWEEARAILDEVSVEHVNDPEVVARRRAVERQCSGGGDGGA